MECVVAAQIRFHIDANVFGNRFQSTYKAGHSTETGLLCSQDGIHLSLSKGIPTPWSSLTCQPPLTQSIMTHSSPLSIRFGFTGTVLRWFTTYLLDHFQSVKIASVISECFKLNFGGLRALSLFLYCSPYTLPLSVSLLQNLRMSNTIFMRTTPCGLSIYLWEFVPTHSNS